MHLWRCSTALRDDLGQKRGANGMEEGMSHRASNKGDLSLCSNYRGIALLSIPGKVFNRVLLNRLKDAANPHLRDHQVGFRKNRSCADQIVNAHHLGAAIGIELISLRQFYRLRRHLTALTRNVFGSY